MNKALQYAFRLLKYRPRAEYELRQRLKMRGFTQSIIEDTIVSLKKRGLIDDFEFARIWVESRIKKPLGVVRLRQELKIKGIDSHLIEQVIEGISSKYSEEQIIRDILERRWEKLKHIEPQKAKRRLFLYLLRRGFSSNKIQEAINQI